MRTLPILLVLSISATSLAFPQDVLIVNGSNDGQRSVEEEEPFIVVAAAVENDGSSDPNEAFIPTKDDTNGPTFNLLSQADLARELLDAEVIEASDDSSQESSSFKFPTNDNGADKAGFKLLTQEDLDDVVILEAGSDEASEEPRLLDIPRDTSSKDEPFFKLPLPDEGEQDEYDDVVVIGVDDDDEGRNFDDIPRDTSGPDEPFFKLPLPDEEEEDVYDDVVIIDVGVGPEEGRNLDDVPRDESEAGQAGPRLPKQIIEVGLDDLVDCFEDAEPGTCLNSHEAWFYDPTHNKCHFFIYSGCGGNSNRFFSEDECIGQCKDAKRKTHKKQETCSEPAPICEKGCTLVKDDEGACLTCNCHKKEEDVARCLEAPKTGLCKALLKYWYYNADRQACEEFTYGGCEAGSSPNKFRTKALCQNACAGVTR